MAAPGPALGAELGQGDVKTFGDPWAGAHGHAEARAGGARALHRHEQGFGPPAVEDGVDHRAAVQRPAEHVQRRHVTGPRPDHGYRSGLVRHLVHLVPGGSSPPDAHAGGEHFGLNGLRANGPVKKAAVATVVQAIATRCLAVVPAGGEVGYALDFLQGQGAISHDRANGPEPPG